MNRIIIFVIFTLLARADNIKLDQAVSQPLGKVVATNAKITQLSSQKQEIVSAVPGHIEKYFVKPGEKVKKGDKIALVESLELSRMTSQFVSLSSQIKAARLNMETAKKLYAQGVGSKQEKNANLIAMQDIKSKRNTLKSQLSMLGIDPDKLESATDKLILYAHADGVVGGLLVPLHSTVDAQAPVVTIVDRNGYYALAYLSVSDALKVTTETKGWIEISGGRYDCDFVQLLPEVDGETQRAQVLFKIQNAPRALLLGAFVEMDVSIPPYQKAVMVKRSALTMFGGEWVVFVPNEEKHEEADRTEDEHGEEHEHEEPPYAPQAVKIVAYAGDFAAVEGMEKGAEYVSDGVYFVKSLMLKSSLGEHGH